LFNSFLPRSGCVQQGGVVAFGWDCHSAGAPCQPQTAALAAIKVISVRFILALLAFGFLSYKTKTQSTLVCWFGAISADSVTLFFKILGSACKRFLGCRSFRRIAAGWLSF